MQVTNKFQAQSFSFFGFNQHKNNPTKIQEHSKYYSIYIE